MATLENEFLKISIRSKGAELTSIYNKKNDLEHLWQANPDIWPWHGPNLFPVVGGCINNEIRAKGKTFPMERHGFARQSEFTLQETDPQKAVFSLRFKNKTLIHYPYKFEFQIEYVLEAQRLTVTYRVHNEDNETIYFSVGAHPAFNVPFFPGEMYEDYYIEFSEEERLERHLLSEKGFFNGKTEPVPLENRKLHLTKDLFNKDALVFKKIASRQVKLSSPKHNHSITVSYEPFSYLGLWAKPGAPFVCIEPWLGCADTEGKSVAIQEKEAIQHVQAGERFEATFSIRIN